MIHLIVALLLLIESLLPLYCDIKESDEGGTI
jgi:hypothetical protein